MYLNVAQCIEHRARLNTRNMGLLELGISTDNLDVSAMDVTLWCIYESRFCPSFEQVVRMSVFSSVYISPSSRCQLAEFGCIECTRDYVWSGTISQCTARTQLSFERVGHIHEKLRSTPNSLLCVFPWVFGVEYHPGFVVVLAPVRLRAVYVRVCDEEE